jgi:uncharacterized protein YjbJ (UPF0337 family)
MVDQLRGKWLQLKGEVKRQWGKLIDDDLTQIEGNYEKIIGMLQQRYGGNVSAWFRSATAAKSTNSYNGVAAGYSHLTLTSRTRRHV